MTQVFNLEQIRFALTKLDLAPAIEEGFVALSHDEAIVPPVGELIFTDPPGETHIKCGYIKNSPYYVVKIAAGFYRNPELGLSSSSGVMLVFSSITGRLETVLLDDGWLTEVRTALAGQIAAKYLASAKINKIAVLGTGLQAQLQVEYLKPVTPCTNIHVWGRTVAHQQRYKEQLEEKGYRVTLAATPAEATKAAQIIITATPSQVPLLQMSDISPGTHITAMGSDTEGKQELATDILKMADIVVADSLVQCRERGEIATALAEKKIRESEIVELGHVLDSSHPGRSEENQITIADLTGVAVQDIKIATAVCQALATEPQENG